jgi:hypothetical protein
MTVLRYQYDCIYMIKTIEVKAIEASKAPVMYGDTH